MVPSPAIRAPFFNSQLKLNYMTCRQAAITASVLPIIHKKSVFLLPFLLCNAALLISVPEDVLVLFEPQRQKISRRTFAFSGFKLSLENMSEGTFPTLWLISLKYIQSKKSEHRN